MKFGFRLSLVDARWALIGGALAALIAFAGLAAIGQVSGFEARNLLNSTLPSIRFLASTVATAAITVVALMVTLLALSNSVDSDLGEVHYRRIQQIAWMAVFAIIAAVLLLLFLSIPFGEAEEVVREWYDWVYYAVIVLSSALGGTVVALSLMLLNAVQGLVRVLAPHVDAEGVAREEAPEEPSDESRSTGHD